MHSLLSSSASESTVSVTSASETAVEAASARSEHTEAGGLSGLPTSVCTTSGAEAILELQPSSSPVAVVGANLEIQPGKINVNATVTDLVASEAAAPDLGPAHSQSPLLASTASPEFTGSAHPLAEADLVELHSSGGNANAAPFPESSRSAAESSAESPTKGRVAVSRTKKGFIYVSLRSAPVLRSFHFTLCFLSSYM